MTETQVRKINAYRILKGLSLEQFLSTLGVRQKTYYDILNGTIRGDLIGSKSYHAKKKLMDIVVNPLPN